MSELEEFANDVMKSLNKSVKNALERKRRLGQYAVIWKDGKVVKIMGHQKENK